MEAVRGGCKGKGRKTGQRWVRATGRQDAVEGKCGKMKCQIPGSGYKCQGDEGGKSVFSTPVGQLFDLRSPEGKDHHRLRSQSAVKCQSWSQYAQKKNSLNIFFFLT